MVIEWQYLALSVLIPLAFGILTVWFGYSKLHNNLRIGINADLVIANMLKRIDQLNNRLEAAERKLSQCEEEHLETKKILAQTERQFLQLADSKNELRQVDG